jgi:hypothetical protein
MNAGLGLGADGKSILTIGYWLKKQQKTDAE